VRWLRFPRILGIVVCLYLIGMSLVFGNLSTKSYRFVHNAQTTTGTVIALLPTPTAGSSRTPSNRPGRLMPTAPKVRYAVGGKSYEYVAAHGRYRQPLHVGDQVTVLYDPDNPARARLRGEGSLLIPLITAGFLTCALAVAVLLFATRNTGIQRRRTHDGEDRSTDAAEDPLEERPDRPGRPTERFRGKPEAPTRKP
jgi:hypothetical protein